MEEVTFESDPAKNNLSLAERLKAGKYSARSQQTMEEFRCSTERINRLLADREHSDSVELLREDRQR